MRLFTALFLLLSCTFFSCKDDLELFSDFKEIPVIYGLLDVQDSVHYLKIYRAFTNNEENFFKVAKDPDSLYYPDILEVTITEKETQKIYTLERIDGDTAGIPAKPGIYAHRPNILYRFKAELVPGYSYQMKVVNLGSGLENTAETEALDVFTSFIPHDDQVMNWSGHTDDLVNFTWKSSPAAKVYELWITFIYHEYNNATGNNFLKKVKYPVFLNRLTLLSGNEQFLNYEYPTGHFYSYIGNSMEIDQNINRKVEGVEFTFTAGGVELASYISNTQAQQGITSQMALKGYTNISNGVGIFSSRITRKFDAELSDMMLDSLCHGQYTRELNFCF